MNKPKRQSMSLETKVIAAFILAITPALVIIILSAFSHYSLLLALTVVPLSLLSAIAGLFYIRKIMQSQFFGIANVIECLRQGDFTMRPSINKSQGAWGEVNFELGLLAKRMHKERIETVESDIILDKLTEEFDVPLLMTDRSGALKHINDAGVELFGSDRQHLLGLSTLQLNIANLFDVETGAVVEHQFPMKDARWEIRRSIIHQHGVRFDVLLLNDLSRALREEERQAWQKLIRVLGHELNNSLASITSVADTMAKQKLVTEDKVLKKGLSVITERTQGLQRFTEAYTSLAKLPLPKKVEVNIARLLNQAAELHGQQVTFELSSDIHACIDADQIEQVLINLVKNGLESGNTEPKVVITAHQTKHRIVISIVDNGHGITNPENLFVPFYTTKVEGSGIGLYLCRQIIEAHQGKLSLQNRQDKSGCIATIWLPT